MEHENIPLESKEDKVEPNQQPETIAASGLARLKAVAKNAPFLSYEEHNQLFQQIADDGTSPEAREALRIIVESYLGFTINEAYGVWLRNPTIELDDIIGIACETLVKNTYDFARGRDYRSFPGYLKKTVSPAVAGEVIFQRYGLSSEKIGWHRSELITYIREKAKLEEVMGREVDWQEVAAKTGQSLEKTKMLDTLRRGVFYYGSDEPQQGYHSPGERESSNAKRILVERGLALLTSDQAKVIDKYYGINGPQYTIGELAKECQITAQAVRSAIYNAKQLLATVLVGLQDGTFDFAAWRKKHPSCRNALMLLGLMGEPLPPSATFTELRIIAMQKLLATDQTEETKHLIAELYGLKDGFPKNGIVLAATSDVGIDTIYYRDRQFLKQYSAVLKEK